MTHIHLSMFCTRAAYELALEDPLTDYDDMATPQLFEAELSSRPGWPRSDFVWSAIDAAVEEVNAYREPKLVDHEWETTGWKDFRPSGTQVTGRQAWYLSDPEEPDGPPLAVVYVEEREVADRGK